MKGQLRIDSMFAFICLDDDGTEGIPAFMTPGGIAMPMVGADLQRVDSLRPIARQMVEAGKKITLVKFSHRETLEEIQ